MASVWLEHPACFLTWAIADLTFLIRVAALIIRRIFQLYAHPRCSACHSQYSKPFEPFSTEQWRTWPRQLISDYYSGEVGNS